MVIQEFTTLPRFEADQVLTASDLNAIVDYLEEQELLTRAKLIGTGIVCGLELELRDNGDTIAIHKGVGVTSKGYLVPFSGRSGATVEEYKFFENFDFEEKTDYSFFFNGDQPMELYRLRAEGTADAEALSQIPGNITDYGVLLYLECFDEDNKLCGGNDCDNKGATRYYNIIPLLVKLNDLRRIICQEESLNVPKSEQDIDDHFNPHYKLPPLNVDRFRNDNRLIISYSIMYDLYDQIIGFTKSKVQQALDESYRLFKPLLQEMYANSTEFPAAVNQDLNAKQKELKDNKPYAVQYFHDLLCDLAEGYNEFREAVFDLMSECCPPLTRFPKHLRLGHLTLQPGCPPSPYRHRFLKAPIYEGQEALRHKVLRLHRKLFLLIKRFENPLKFTDLRITPSRELDRPLSQRAIPYYYNLLGAHDPLLGFWNPDLMRRCRKVENMSYHADRYAQSEYFKTPLRYSLKQYDFLRIEGHLGKNYLEALREITRKRDAQNLPFDLVALKVGKGPRSVAIDDMHCNFRDLETVCEAWKREIACLLTGLIRQLSGIKIDNVIAKPPAGGSVVDAGGGTVVSPPAGGAIFDSGDITFAGRRTIDFGRTRVNLRPATKVVNTVKSGIDTTENSLGSYVFESVKTGSRNANDYAVIVESNLKKNPAIAGLATADFDLAFGRPTKLITQAYALAEQIEGDCDTIEVDRVIAAHKALMTEARAYLEALQKYLDSSDDKEISINALTIIQSVSFFANNCSLEQFKVIKSEMDLRKAELARLTLLHEFMGKHPGIDHAGGVPKGGTFILVYHEEEDQDGGTGRPLGPETVTGVLRDPAGTLLPGANVILKGTTKGVVTDSQGRFLLNLEKEDPRELVFSVPGLETRTKNISRGPINNLEIVVGGFDPPTGADAPASGTVVGDFFLPYICCSECPSIDYVLPPEPVEPVNLDIEPRVFCHDDQPVPFTVTPEDGEVTGDAGVEKDANGNFQFNPALVDLGTANQRIVRFQVNGQDVTLAVMVERAPEPSFGAELSWETVGGSIRLIAQLDNDTAGNADHFEWVFYRENPAGNRIELLRITRTDTSRFSQQLDLKPGQKLAIELISYTANGCFDSVAGTFEVPPVPENVTFEVLDPNNERIDPPVLFNFMEGDFSLIVRPGEGKLLDTPDSAALEFKQLDQNPDFNSYRFVVLEKEPRNYLIEYETTNGTKGSLTIRVLRRGVRPPGIDPNFSASITNFSKGLDAIGRSPLFSNVLGRDATAFVNTAQVDKILLSASTNEATYDALSTGERIDDITALIEEGTADNVNRMSELSGGVRRRTDLRGADLLINLYRLQVGQLVQTIAIQKEDINMQNPLSKLITVIAKQVKTMKRKKVDINKNGVLVQAIKEGNYGMLRKPFAKKRLNELIETITS